MESETSSTEVMHTTLPDMLRLCTVLTNQDDASITDDVREHTFGQIVTCLKEKCSTLLNGEADRHTLVPIFLQMAQHRDSLQFWSQICEKEMDSEALQSKHYIRDARAQLIPELLALLEKQEIGEDATPMLMSPPKAAHICLKFVVQTIKDDAVPLIFGYISKNVANSVQWQKRDASLQAFGVLINDDGPDKQKLSVLVKQTLPALIKLMKDPQAGVRDSLAWVLGRLCEVLPETILEPGTIDQVVQVLQEGLAMEPSVAANVCWAIGSLYEAAKEAASTASGEDAKPQTFALSKCTQPLVTELFVAAERADATSNNLQAAAYEALMTMCGNLAEDCYPFVLQCTKTAMQQLEQAVTIVARRFPSCLPNQCTCLGHADLNSAGWLGGGQCRWLQFQTRRFPRMLDAIVTKQGLLCGVLTAAVRAHKKADLVLVAPALADTIISMLGGATGVLIGAVAEDAFMLVDALAEALGNNFAPYLEAVKPFIMLGLRNVAAVETCKVCVGLVGDIATSMGAESVPHCNAFMVALRTTWEVPGLDPSIRPIVLAACGDIATGIGGDAFVHHLQFVIAALQESAVSAARNVSNEGYDVIDEQNDLRNACLQAYTAILLALKGQGATASPNVRRMVPTMPHIIQFISECMKDFELDEAFVRDAAGIVGDIIATYGTEVKQILPVSFCQELVTQAVNGPDNKDRQTKSNGRYAQKLMAKIGIHTRG